VSRAATAQPSAAQPTAAHPTPAQDQARESAPARPSAATGAGAAEARHETAHIGPQRVEPRAAADPGATAQAGPAAIAGGALFARAFGDLRVGDRFTTADRTVAERDILDFAALTGDAHPQHTDPDWAASSRFGEQIAHGLLVLSLAVGLLPLDPDRVVALRRVGDAVFKQPVKIGDTVHVEGQIVRTREVDAENGLVEARLRIVNERGRLAVRTDVELVWRS
jgi:3-hydroxybutyryl-CoA dehydratase